MTYIPDWTELPGPYDVKTRRGRRTIDEELDEVYEDKE